MKYFEKFVSNTYAGSGSQNFFCSEGVKTGRIFYKISVGGEYNYSILFNNIIDSTFADGSKSHKNIVCDEWQIKEIKAAKTRLCTFGQTDDMYDEFTDKYEIELSDFIPLTFDGKAEKTVAPGEFFATDATPLSFEKGEYLCLEITYEGKMIPNHPETRMPSFIKTESGWKYSTDIPFPAMIGCDRKVEKRVAYLGDSITQGIGAPINSYEHWNARVSEMIGEGYSFWNLGLGYGRASDAASNGAWLYKAKQNDVIVVCYGVNDLLQGASASQLKKDLSTIVYILKNAGLTVLLQTVPPFDYSEAVTEKWNEVNEYIENELSQTVDAVFDCVPVLCTDSEHRNIAKYGGHPNSEGGAAWAEALYPTLKSLLM